MTWQYPSWDVHGFSKLSEEREDAFLPGTQWHSFLKELGTGQLIGQAIETAFPDLADFSMLEKGEQSGGHQKGSLTYTFTLSWMNKATLQKSLPVPANISS